MAKIREMMGRKDDLELAATRAMVDSWISEEPESLREATARMRNRKRKTI